MRAVAEERLELGDVVQEHLDRCLGCLACETACPAGVQYGHLLEDSRRQLAAVGRGPGALGRAVLSVVAGGPGSSVVFAASRLARRLGVARLIGRWVGGVPGLSARLLDATRPAFPSGDSAVRESGHDGSRPSYTLLEGCVMKRLFGHVHAATRRTMVRVGYREVEAPEQGCCGALHAHAGDLDGARVLARRNILAFEASNADAIATNSAGCGQAMREYPEWLDGEEEWRHRAEAVAERVRDVSTLLAAAPRALSGRLTGRVGYDAPCHLLHGQRVRDAPLQLLDAIEGLERVSIPSSEQCCGGAGTYNLTRPELSAELLSSKLDEIEEADVGWVATGNPGCIMQIGAGLAARGGTTRVVHPIELLDRAAE
jgi:glycolate oxidase iron-sulfur subunit